MVAGDGSDGIAVGLRVPLAGLAAAASLVFRRFADQRTLVPSLDAAVDSLLVALRLNSLVGAVPVGLASVVVWLVLLVAFHRTVRSFFVEAEGVLLADRVVLGLTAVVALGSAASATRYLRASLARGAEPGLAGALVRALVVEHALLAVAGVASLSWYLHRTYGPPYAEDSELQDLLSALYPESGRVGARRRTLRDGDAGALALAVGRLAAVAYLPAVLVVIAFGLGTVASLVGLLSPVAELLLVGVVAVQSLPGDALPWHRTPSQGSTSVVARLADVEGTALTAVGSVLRNDKGQMVVFPFVVLLSFPLLTVVAAGDQFAAVAGEAAAALAGGPAPRGALVSTARLLGAATLEVTAGALSLWVLLRLALRLPGFLQAWNREPTDPPTVRRPAGLLAVPTALYVAGVAGETLAPTSWLAPAYVVGCPLALLGALCWVRRTRRTDGVTAQAYATDRHAVPVALVQTWVALALGHLLTTGWLATPTALPRNLLVLAGAILAVGGVYFVPDVERYVANRSGDRGRADVALSGAVLAVVAAAVVLLDVGPVVTAVLLAGVVVGAVLLATETGLR